MSFYKVIADGGVFNNNAPSEFAEQGDIIKFKSIEQASKAEQLGLVKKVEYIEFSDSKPQEKKKDKEVDYHEMTVKELTKLVHDAQIKSSSRDTKADLIKKLTK